MNNRLINAIQVGLYCCAAIVVCTAIVLAYHLFAPQYATSGDTHIYIDRDDTIDSVFRKVRTVATPRYSDGFEWIMQHKNYGDRIRTGKYLIKRKDSAYRLYQRLSSGTQTPVNLTIGSVRTLGKLAKTVSNQLMIDSAEVAQRLNDPAFVDSLGYTKETLYCLFIPNTYQVYWNISADNFLSRMRKENERYWNAERLRRAQEIGLTPAQIYTIASIVDEETNNAGEQPRVAGLYINRLRKGMPLQADPTVKFALQNFELRRITRAHLEIESPYNTYRNAGLPPGPIRIPTLIALESVLHYEQHSYIYMCAKEDFSGTHNFATTLAEHNANARKYWEALNYRNIY